MPRAASWLGLSIVLGLVECGPPEAPPLPPDAAQQLGEQPFQQGPLPEKAKIFLVAGGTDSASFAQEIMDQRRIWIEAGFSADEIACYWAKPTPAAFEEDARQYYSLAKQLEACWRATPDRVFEDLATAAKRAQPFVYLYVTSHGTPSILEDASKSKREEIQQALSSANDCEQEALDQPAILLGGDAAGHLHLPAVLESMREGEGDEAVFTPRNLRRALASFSPSTQKIVVLQACYSGAFLDRDGKRRTRDGITDLPNVTAITSARYDRASFVCQSGVETTYFGRAYNRVLERTPGLSSPDSVHWRTLYLRARNLIERREDAGKVSRTHPRFFRSPDSIDVNPPVESASCTD